MPTDLQIAREASLKPIREIAHGCGLNDDELVLFGDHTAKVRLDVLDRLGGRPRGKLVVVTAITPTPLGEGKTVQTIGVSLGLLMVRGDGAFEPQGFVSGAEAAAAVEALAAHLAL